MTAEQATALIIAITALVTAVGSTYMQIRGLRQEVRQNHVTMNGRLQDLLEVSTLAAKKQGELEGRDWMTKKSP